ECESMGMQLAVQVAAGVVGETGEHGIAGEFARSDTAYRQARLDNAFQARQGGLYGLFVNPPQLAYLEYFRKDTEAFRGAERQIPAWPVLSLSLHDPPQTAVIHLAAPECVIQVRIYRLSDRQAQLIGALPPPVAVL